jgi:photosystem II stability/assembly factor-like uncharacterized protein
LTGKNLFDVFFLGQDSGWISGTGGTIMSTTNGGVTWTMQASQSTRKLLSVHFADPLTGWAVGDRGTILKSTDGGVLWNPQASGTTRILNHVYFVDDQKGWAVGLGGIVLITTDGGDTWQDQPSGTLSTLYDVNIANSNYGWAVGSGGTIIRFRATGAPIAQPVVEPEAAIATSNYPNPFNPSTMIRFTLPEQGKVSLKVYNMIGQEIASLLDGEELDAGEHFVPFNGKGANNAELASGVYFYRVLSKDGEYQAVQKMMLLK